jgi:hypothetical protein
MHACLPICFPACLHVCTAFMPVYLSVVDVVAAFLLLFAAIVRVATAKDNADADDAPFEADVSA